MATTTNFGWETPDDTDLVKDGAAAIRTALGGVDTSFVDLKGGTTGQILAKASATDLDFVWSSDATGMANPMTTTGDTIYSSSGSTPARLGIGTAGQVLQVNSGATAPEWADPAAANPSFSLLSTTTLTGASTFTISSLSGYNTFYMIVKNASSASASTAMRYRINGNTSSIYNSYGLTIDVGAAYSVSIATQNVIETTSLALGVMSSNAGSQVSGYIRLEGCNSSGLKMMQSASGVGPESVAGAAHRVLGGFINTTDVISSITFFTDNSSNFDNGTLRIYGSVA